ncbi:AAR2 protein [Ancylostoma caninum]|uniref:Protein AAR2 homolog n=1 Tax=Ancylostoma caninum TaxID=29170 RepID=A0A368F171_ANCCA|nr:AAR2 protein [Ancylostoma caninum]
MGLKMIPAGVHFVYCSVKGAPRIGFFHNFKSEEIVVKKWDKQKETFSDEVNRFRLNLKNIDSTLGPYPFENYRSWYALTDFINGQTVERLNPLKGKISAQAELVSMETCLMENEELNATVGCSNSVDREHPVRTRFVDQQGLPIMKIRDGYEIRFLAIPQLNVSIFPLTIAVLQSGRNVTYSFIFISSYRSNCGDREILIALRFIPFLSLSYL